MTQALLIKAQGAAQVVSIPDEDAYLTLKDLVGGWIDAVTREEFTMYVHDEGLIIVLAPNVAASIMVGQVIVGDVVVLGNSSTGEESDAPEYLLTDENLSICTEMNADAKMTGVVRLLIEKRASR